MSASAVSRSVCAGPARPKVAHNPCIRWPPDLSALPENYPLTVLESMACGTPVAAFGVGGIPEQIDHLRTGTVARSEDVDDLADGLVHILNRGGQSRDMRAAAREFVVRTNSVDAAAAEYRRAYGEAVRLWSRRSGRGPRVRRGWLSRSLARTLGWAPKPEPVDFGALLCAPAWGGAV